VTQGLQSSLADGDPRDHDEGPERFVPRQSLAQDDDAEDDTDDSGLLRRIVNGSKAARQIDRERDQMAVSTGTSLRAHRPRPARPRSAGHRLPVPRKPHLDQTFTSSSA